MKTAVLSFYSFTPILDTKDLQIKLLQFCKSIEILGTILIADEGINGSISGEKHKLNSVMDYLKLLGIYDINIKVNYCKEHPFSKMKVKTKPEIVSMKVGSIDVNGLKGEYVSSDKWDALINDENVVVIDTRNNYEYDEGTFHNAVNPGIETFREFPGWVQSNRGILEGKKVAMFCTGGIRCEKATAYLKAEGIEDVYHLYGGILQYLEDTKNKSGMWQGNCFVFDDRYAVDSKLSPANLEILKK